MAAALDHEQIGSVIDALDGALGFSKNLGPRLSREMAADAAQHGLRSARDELRAACVAAGFDPWGDSYPWEA